MDAVVSYLVQYRGLSTDEVRRTVDQCIQSIVATHGISEDQVRQSVEKYWYITLPRSPYPYVVLQPPKVPVIKRAREYQASILDAGKGAEKSYVGGMTREQIDASPFVYLRHMTRNVDKILETWSIDHYFSLAQKQVTYRSQIDGASFEQTLQDHIQYPGIYCSPVTQSMIRGKYEITDEYDSIHRQQSYASYIEQGQVNQYGEYEIVFSLALLQQKNWHMNIFDTYGAITNVTFTCRTLSKYMVDIELLWSSRYVEVIKGAEIVYHDAILMDFAECIIVSDEATKKRVEKLLMKHKRHLPVRVRSQALYQTLLGQTLMRGQYHLNPVEPQYCYTNSVQFGMPPPEILAMYKKNPFTGRTIDSDDHLSHDREYILEKRARLCHLPAGTKKQKRYVDAKVIRTQEIRNKLKDIYTHDPSLRSPVAEQDHPPWKYTPQYYEGL